MEYKTGTLVEFRSRPWVVQQSSDKDILILKSASNLNGNLNCSKELEHYAS